MPSNMNDELTELRKHYHDLLMEYEELHFRVVAIQDLLIRQKILTRGDVEQRVKDLIAAWDKLYGQALDEERASLLRKMLDEPQKPPF
jgi:hypothetical protein